MLPDAQELGDHLDAGRARDEARRSTCSSPSAQGSDPCVDCSCGSDSPASSRRSSLSLVQPGRMAAADLAIMRTHLGALLERVADPRMQGDIERRLDILYEAAPPLSPQTQQHLLRACGH